MRAGKLRHYVTINDRDNTSGQRDTDYPTTIAQNVPASIEDSRGSESPGRSKQVESVGGVLITVRDPQGGYSIDPEMQVVDSDDVEYEILWVEKDSTQKRALRLHCKRVGG